MHHSISRNNTDKNHICLKVWAMLELIIINFHQIQFYVVTYRNCWTCHSYEYELMKSSVIKKTTLFSLKFVHQGITDYNSIMTGGADSSWTGNKPPEFMMTKCFHVYMQYQTSMSELTLKWLGRVFFQNVISFSDAVHLMCNIFIWNWSNTINV